MSPAATQEAHEDVLATLLSGLDAEALETSSEYRRAVTRTNPMLFALIYLPHHLIGRETGNEITFSEFHTDVYEHIREWMRADDEPAEHRDVYVAPRGCGKSTMFFLIGPMWAAAHGHRRFAAAFADSASQAELHLQTFKRELETNQLLRRDFPKLCRPAMRPGGATVSDNRALLLCSNGFVFAARGVDGSSLGMKVGQDRPDLIILDDIEPGEEHYSAYQKAKRLGAILDSILPLNVYARVVMVGTVTMPGSVIHDAVKTVTMPEESVASWVTDEGFTCHYYPAILRDNQGEERSVWPAKWSMTYLRSIRHTRSFLKNMMNDPMAADGDYWTIDDIRHGNVDGPLTHQLLSIDPAVTTKGTSDFTGLAVIGYSKPAHQCLVRWARAVKIAPGEQLRSKVLELLTEWPDVSGVLIETNQGGDTWRAILHGLPVPLRTVHQSEPKDVRAAKLLNHYQRGRVRHEIALPQLEEQQVAFPKAPNDDLVDCVGTGVEVFLGKKPKVGMTAARYA